MRHGFTIESVAVEPESAIHRVNHSFPPLREFAQGLF